MNFYELYNLINENTVSQEVKKIQLQEKELILAGIEKMIAKRVVGISSESKKILAKWLFYNILNKYKNKDKELAYMNVPSDRPPIAPEFNVPANQVLVDTKDYIAYSLDDLGNINPQLLSKFNTIAFKIEDLKKLTSKYHSDLAKGNIEIPGAKDGEITLAFPDGYKWVDLKRGYCSIEAKAGKHCGNQGAQRGDTILSLRDKNNYVVLTFVLNNGTLEERKARANTKPTKKHHPYIMELLKLPIIKEIGPGRYLPDKDFQLNDLNNDQIKELIDSKGINFLNARIKADLCKDENTPEDLLRRIYNESSETPSYSNDLFWIIFAICENQNAPEDILADIGEKVLYKYSYMTMDVYKLLAGNKNTPKEILEKIADYVGKIKSDDYYSTAEALAKNDKSDPEILRNVYNYIKNIKLYDKINATSGKRPVWMTLVTSLLKNKTPEDIKEEIVEKFISFLRNSKLADERKDSVVDYFLNSFKTVPVEILSKIVDIEGLLDIKVDIADNPNTPKEILEKLFKQTVDAEAKFGSSDPYNLKSSLVTNPNTPENIKELIRSEWRWVTNTGADEPLDFDPNML
jgi:hypothetical protein